MDDKIGSYRRLLGYLRPYKFEVTLAYISMLGASLLNLVVPQVIKNAIDQGIANRSAQGLYSAAVIILGIAVIRAIAAFGMRYYGNWLTFQVSYDLRNHFFESIPRLPFAFHDRAQTGDLMSRATSDISESEKFVGIGLMDLNGDNLTACWSPASHHVGKFSTFTLCSWPHARSGLCHLTFW